MITNYWANYVLNTAYRAADTAVYVGLSSTAPLKDGTGVTEPTGGGYARVRVAAFTTPADGVISNADTLEFPMSSGEWFPSSNPAAYYVLFNGSSAGAQVLAAGQMRPEMEIPSGTALKIFAGVMRISLSGEEETEEV